MHISEQSSYKNQMFAIWCGPIFTVLTLIGWMGISQGLLPAHADWSPEAIKQFFLDHQFRIELGCSIWITACCFLAVWTAQLSAVMATIEGRMPIWAIVQGTTGGGIVVLVMSSCCLWINAAYRSGASAELVVSANDSAWFALVITGPILTTQMLATAIVMLQDNRAAKLIPTWLSYASIAGAIGVLGTVGPAFTTSGPFAYHGVLGYYLPMLLWGLWFDIHSIYMWKALVKQRRFAPATNRVTGAVPV